MTFKENLRLEQIYFLKLKDIVSDLTAWKGSESDKKTLDVLNSCIAADEAILLLYKNIGEAWNDLASQIVSEKEALEALKSELESFKGEINAKIDDVNNFLNSVIAGIEERVAAVEADLSTLARIKYLHLSKDAQNNYFVVDGNTQVTGNQINTFRTQGLTVVLNDPYSGKFYVLIKSSTYTATFCNVEITSSDTIFSQVYCNRANVELRTSLISRNATVTYKEELELDEQAWEYDQDTDEYYQFATDGKTDAPYLHYFSVKNGDKNGLAAAHEMGLYFANLTDRDDPQSIDTYIYAVAKNQPQGNLFIDHIMQSVPGSEEDLFAILQCF